MKLKKLYAVLCATALTFTLAGCSGGEKKEESKAPAVKVMEGDKLASIEKDDKKKKIICSTMCNSTYFHISRMFRRRKKRRI